MTPEKFYFLSYLLSKDALSLKDVAVLSLSLLLDGLGTTTPTTLFCLYALAIDQRVQQAVYNEIVDVVGKDPELPVTTDHINKMSYLKAFVKETFRYAITMSKWFNNDYCELFRLWPNGTEVSRYTEKAMILSGFEIPVGTHVDLNPSVNYRDPKYFPEPDSHIPERWLRKDADYEKHLKNLTLEGVEINELIDAAEKVHPYILTPFGHGTRMCAGRR